MKFTLLYLRNIPAALPGRGFLGLLICACLLLPASSHADCSGPTGRAGDFVYNKTSHVPQFCDGSNWSAMGKLPGTGGSSGCTGPAGSDGDFIYNTTNHVPQYCDGAIWRAMGKAGSGAGGAGCSNPTGAEGRLVYNARYNLPQYCDGANWVAVSKLSNAIVSPFSFMDQTGATPGTTMTSSPVTLSGGFSYATAVCGSGCSNIYINGVSRGTAATGVNSGDTISISQTVSSSYNTVTQAAVSVGQTTSASWSVKTHMIIDYMEYASTAAAQGAYVDTFTITNPSTLYTGGSYTTAVSGSFVSSAAVYEIAVAAWGGGGGGGGAFFNSAYGGKSGGSGGGGGAYTQKTISLLPSSVVYYTVGGGGTGGIGGADYGTIGITSSLQFPSGTDVCAAAPGKGGGSGNGNNVLAQGAGGTVAASGDIKYAGGDGALGTWRPSGAGGGGAGSTGNGGAASGQTAGTGTTEGGGSGGAGWYDVANNGNPGTAAGGGGGGADTSASVYKTGGSGAAGRVTWYYPPLKFYSSSEITYQGSYSLMGAAAKTVSAGCTGTRTFSALDLSDATALTFNLYAGRTGSNIKFQINGACDYTPNMPSANTWQSFSWDISACTRTAITTLTITIVNAAAANVFYIDNFDTNN